MSENEDRLITEIAHLKLALQEAKQRANMFGIVALLLLAYLWFR